MGKWDWPETCYGTKNMKPFNVRFPGICRCGERVAAGSPTFFTDRKIVACAACNAELRSVNAKQTVAAAEVTADPVECSVRVNQVRYSTDTFAVLSVTLNSVSGGASPFVPGAIMAVVGGCLGSARPEDELLVRGVFENSQHGWQLRAASAVPQIGATDRGLLVFLQRFPNVGEARAQRIVAQLGGREAVLRALEHDPSVLATVDGITPERAAEIGAAFREAGELREGALFLADLQLGEALSNQVLAVWGSHAKATLLENPYYLRNLAGVGFIKADQVAQRMGIAKDDDRRLEAAVEVLLSEQEDEGHTFSTLDDLCNS